MAKYPEHIYKNITSDSNTWGTSCNQEMARREAERNYDRKRANRIELQVKLGAIALLALLCVYIYATMPQT